MPSAEKDRPAGGDATRHEQADGTAQPEGGQGESPSDANGLPAEIPFNTPFPRPGMGVLKSVVAFVAVGAVIAGVVWYFDRPDEGGAFEKVTSPAAAEGPAPKEGSEAPDFRVQTLDGDYVQLSEFQGRPVWINFWATWCSSCRAEMPDIQAVHEEYESQGLVVLALNRQEPESTVKEYSESTGLAFTIGLDSDLRVAAEYRVTGLPTHFFVDEDGVLREIHYGSMSKQTMEESAEELLSPSAERGDP